MGTVNKLFKIFTLKDICLDKGTIEFPAFFNLFASVYRSLFFCSLLAVDRYRCIMQPDRPHFNSIATVSISLVMTILSVLLTIPMFVTAEVS